MTPSGLPRWLAGFCATVPALIEWVAQKPASHRDPEGAPARWGLGGSPKHRDAERL